MLDLHLHSIFSDGSETPERICELAAEAGLSAIALTDHDGLAGITRAQTRADEVGVRLVPGCEVSCLSEHGSVHVLCYFVSSEGNALADELEQLANDRSNRNEQLADKLIELGLPISLDEVMAEAGGTGVGRPHFAAVLVRNGAASSIQDAFDRYLARGAPGYVHKARVTPPEVLAKAHESGALGVLAHPLSLGLDPSELEAFVAGLSEDGLVGLECYYGRYDAATRLELVELARRYGLTPTGGSDYHGSYKPDLAVGVGTGDLEVPDELLAELDSRLVRPAS